MSIEVKQRTRPKKYNSNITTPRWEIFYFDRYDNVMKTDMFPTIKKLNEKLGLNLTADIIRRINTGFRVDKSMTQKNAFLKKWGHIKIKKLY